MLNTILSLGLVGLSSAVPLNSRQVVPHYPESSIAKGFHFVANVTDPSTDLTPSVNGWIFQGIHVGAGYNEAVILPKDADDQGRIFYHNGTGEDIRCGKGSILTDAGPIDDPFAFGIYVQSKNEADLNYPNEYTVGVNGGSGTIGVTLAAFPNPYFYLEGGLAGLFVACPRTVPYYHKEYIVIRYAYDTVDPDTALNVHHVPQGCTAVNLIPECDTLPDVPADSHLHDFAQNSRCYEDVAAINWTEYGP